MPGDRSRPRLRFGSARARVTGMNDAPTAVTLAVPAGAFRLLTATTR